MSDPGDCQIQGGLLPNHIWQMDVTHVGSFRNTPYVHTTVDSSLGFIFATARSGEGTSHAISHCLQTFAVLSLPKQIKTDNGPGYTSKTFQQFCHKF